MAVFGWARVLALFAREFRGFAARAPGSAQFSSKVSTVAGVEGSEFTSVRIEKTSNGLYPQTAMLVYCNCGSIIYATFNIKKVSTVAVSLVLIHVSLY